MNGRDKEPDLADSVVGELQQITANLLLIKPGVTGTNLFVAGLYPWMLLETIIFAGATLAENFVDCFTTVAAKGLFVKYNRG